MQTLREHNLIEYTHDEATAFTEHEDWVLKIRILGDLLTFHVDDAKQPNDDDCAVKLILETNDLFGNGSIVVYFSQSEIKNTIKQFNATDGY